MITVPGRSIPACTGEPTPFSEVRYRSAVYPRVYGGTRAASSCSRHAFGLSPRVRGNLALRPAGNPSSRSIPACTGEPVAGAAIGVLMAVYPRVYGGTSRSVAMGGALAGLSPRVRGNPVGPVLRCHFMGSIPACTGEPRPGGPGPGRESVYPRVYGGTGFGDADFVQVAGLSPRVRGNLAAMSSGGVSMGSIPACTGEPF